MSGLVLGFLILGIEVMDSHILGSPPTTELPTRDNFHFSFLDRMTQNHSSWPWTHCVAQEGLELVILLAQHSKDLELQTCATRPASLVLFKWLFHVTLDHLQFLFFGEETADLKFETQGIVDKACPGHHLWLGMREGQRTWKKNGSFHGNHKFRANKKIVKENTQFSIK